MVPLFEAEACILPGTGTVPDLLARWRAGDKAALHTLMPLVYSELHAVAHRCLRDERPGHTLQSTALVHEAYARLVGVQKPVQAKDHTHFIAVASRLMRQILVDYARQRGAEKRGPAYKVELTSDVDLPQRKSVDVVALDDALNRLSKHDPQQEKIVELRFFGGLTLEETAEALAISTATVKRDWNMAKAWLTRELQRGAGGINRPMGQS